MDGDRKKPGIGFLCTIATFAVLAYSASFGPACWLTTRATILGKIVRAAYLPFGMVATRSPRLVSDTVLSYGTLFEKDAFASVAYGVFANAAPEGVDPFHFPPCGTVDHFGDSEDAPEFD
jgi:hypothetical protein